MPLRWWSAASSAASCDSGILIGILHAATPLLLGVRDKNTSGRPARAARAWASVSATAVTVRIRRRSASRQALEAIRKVKIIWGIPCSLNKADRVAAKQCRNKGTAQWGRFLWLPTHAPKIG